MGGSVASCIVKARENLDEPTRSQAQWGRVRSQPNSVHYEGCGKWSCTVGPAELDLSLSRDEPQQRSRLIPPEQVSWPRRGVMTRGVTLFPDRIFYRLGGGRVQRPPTRVTSRERSAPPRATCSDAALSLHRPQRLHTSLLSTRRPLRRRRACGLVPPPSGRPPASVQTQRGIDAPMVTILLAFGSKPSPMFMAGAIPPLVFGAMLGA